MGRIDSIYLTLTFLFSPQLSFSAEYLPSYYPKSMSLCEKYADRISTLKKIKSSLMGEIDIIKSMKEDSTPQINYLKELEERLNNLETKVKDCK